MEMHNWYINFKSRLPVERGSSCQSTIPIPTYSHRRAQGTLVSQRGQIHQRLDTHKKLRVKEWIAAAPPSEVKIRLGNITDW